MSDFDSPPVEGVRDHLTQMLAAAPLEGFSVIEYPSPDYGKEAFALVRPDGTVWVVTIQEGKLVMVR